MMQDKAADGNFPVKLISLFPEKDAISYETFWRKE